MQSQLKTAIVLLAVIGGILTLHSNAEAVEACVSPTGCYVNSSGHLVPRPHVNGTHDPRATALCRDGTESYSQHHAGTCSGHHGVQQWYR